MKNPFEDLKALVAKVLPSKKLPIVDGKLVLSAEDKAAIDAEFSKDGGSDFLAKFESAINAELALININTEAKITEATETAKAEAKAEAQAEAQKVIDGIIAESKKSIEGITAEFTKKMETQASEYTSKIETLASSREEDITATEKPEANAGAKTVYAINRSAKHNVIAEAYVKNNNGPYLEAADATIDVADLKTEFGVIATKDKDFIIKKLTQPTETEKYMTTKLADDEWRATQALISTVVQQFSPKFTPLGQTKVTPLTIKNYRHKINVSIIPSEVVASWLGYMYDTDLTPSQMPISKYIIDNLIVPKIDEDREMYLVAKGEFEALGTVTTGAAGQATGKSMDGFITILRKEYENADTKVNFVALGVLTNSNIVDKIDAFVDGLDELYQTKEMNIFQSVKVKKMYKRKYQELYPTTKAGDKTDDMVNFSNQTLVALPSMSGLNSFFTTPKDNFIRLRNKNSGTTKLWMQEVDYEVKVFAEWYEGVGFAIAEAVTAYIDPIWLTNKYAVENNASALLIKHLTDAGCANVNAGKLAGYKTAIAAESGIADLAALQAIVTTVNAAV